MTPPQRTAYIAGVLVFLITETRNAAPAFADRLTALLRDWMSEPAQLRSADPLPIRPTH